MASLTVKEYVAAMSSGYSPKDAQVIGPALDSILERNASLPTHVDRVNFVAAEVVKEAEPVASPLHRYFEWDDSKAAHLYRIRQAKHMVASIDIKVVTKGVEKTFKAFPQVPVPKPVNVVPVYSLPVSKPLISLPAPPRALTASAVSPDPPTNLTTPVPPQPPHAEPSDVKPLESKPVVEVVAKASVANAPVNTIVNVEPEKGYVSLNVIHKKPEMARQIALQAKRELDQWRLRYGTYVAFFPDMEEAFAQICQSVDHIINRLEDKSVAEEISQPA